MSRIYRVKVSETMDRIIHVEDGVASTIKLLPILQKESMQELLSSELEKRGFKRVGDKLSREKDDNIKTVIDLPTGEVKITITNDVEVSCEKSTEVTNDDDYKDREKILVEEAKDKLLGELDKQISDKQQELQAIATKKLEDELRSIRAEMDEVINAVTTTALKKRAEHLGDIEEMTDDGNGNVMIKVRV